MCDFPPSIQNTKPLAFYREKQKQNRKNRKPMIQLIHNNYEPLKMEN